MRNIIPLHDAIGRAPAAGQAAGQGVVTLAAGSDMLTSVLDLFSQFATIGGGVWLVWGAITVGINMKDQNGPGMQTGAWQIVGGGLIIAAALLFKNIVL